MISKEKKAEILEYAKECFETGHFPKDAHRADLSEKEYELLCEYYNLGPAGFLEEFYDELEFDPDFVAEYGRDLIPEHKWHTKEICIRAIVDKLNLDKEDAEIVYELFVDDGSLDEFESVEEFKDYLKVNTLDLLSCAVDDALSGGSEATARALMEIEDFIEG